MTDEMTEVILEHYLELNITEPEIEKGVIRVMRHKYAKASINLIVAPYLLLFFLFTLCQCFLCSLPCLSKRHSICFRQQPGTIDKKGDIWVAYSDYVKYYPRAKTKLDKKVIPVQLSSIATNFSEEDNVTDFMTDMAVTKQFQTF